MCCVDEVVGGGVRGHRRSVFSVDGAWSWSVVVVLRDYRHTVVKFLLRRLPLPQEGAIPSIAPFSNSSNRLSFASSSAKISPI